jgi:hypothetical protein
VVLSLGIFLQISDDIFGENHQELVSFQANKINARYDMIGKQGQQLARKPSV